MDEFDFSLFKEIGNVSVLENYGIFPTLCIHDILLYLEPEDLVKVFCSCRLFHKIGNTDLFWKEYTANFLGDGFEGILKAEKGKGEDEVNFKRMFHDYYCSPFLREDIRFKDIFDGKIDSSSNSQSEKPDLEVFELLLKFLIVGDAKVGKSMLLLRFADDVYSDAYISTIGVDFKLRTVRFRNRDCKTQIWDTAGQQRFRTITKSYYRGAQGVIICFSLTDRKSFENVEDWHTEVKESGSENAHIVVVGLKSELTQEREVSRREVRELLSKLGVPMCMYCESSSAESTCISYPFGKLLEACVDSIVRKK